MYFHCLFASILRVFPLFSFFVSDSISCFICLLLLSDAEIGVAMEFMQRGTLEDVLLKKRSFASSSPTDRMEVLQLLNDVAIGLNFLHAYGSLVLI